MKQTIKKIGLGLLIILVVFGVEQTYKYFYNKYTVSKQIEESTKRKYEAEEKAKKLDEAFKKLENALQEQIDFMENLCFSFWQENKVPSDVAVIQCKCEKEMYSKTMPSGDIWFIMDNLNSFDFLLYKKDEKATKIMDKIKNIRKECTIREAEKINLIFRTNNP